MFSFMLAMWLPFRTPAANMSCLLKFIPDHTVYLYSRIQNSQCLISPVT